MALDPTTGSTVQKKRKRKPQRRPPPPPSYGSPQRSVESPGSSSQVSNPVSLKSYSFLRVNSGVNWRGLDPLLLQRINILGRRTNNIITLSSGFRTHADQRRLYYSLRAENPDAVVAAPGTSNHETGDAADALVDGQPIASAISESEINAVGLRSLASINDPVHLELADGGGGGAAVQTSAPSTPGRALPVKTSSVSQEYAGTSSAPVPTDEFAGATDTAELLPFELEDEEPQAARMNAQQRAQTWQLIAQQPGASPEAQSLARIAQISIGG